MRGVEGVGEVLDTKETRRAETYLHVSEFFGIGMNSLSAFFVTHFLSPTLYLFLLSSCSFFVSCVLACCCWEFWAGGYISRWVSKRKWERRVGRWGGRRKCAMQWAMGFERAGTRAGIEKSGMRDEGGEEGGL